MQAQTKPRQSPQAPQKADAYYNFAMGHLYAELAGAYGNRAEYVNKAIEHYRQALKLDPAAGFLVEELTDLYIQAGRLRDAVLEAEEMLKQNPDNLDARRILARIYTRMIGDTQQGRIDEKMLRNAIEQYEKIVAKDPKDTETWLMLGRLYKYASNSTAAEKAYNAVLAADPNNEDALAGLAFVYSDLGDTTRAIEKLKQLSDTNPSPRTLTVLANAYEQVRDYKSAAAVSEARARDAAGQHPREARAGAEPDVLGELRRVAEAVHRGGRRGARATRRRTCASPRSTARNAISRRRGPRSKKPSSSTATAWKSGSTK